MKNDALREYASLLQRSGFTIYEPKNEFGNYFAYSRVVDGQECFGFVERGSFGGYEHYMPIKPSSKDGSSMYVDDVPNELTVHAARMVASPSNINDVVGRHDNWIDRTWLEQGYEKWEVVE